MYSPEVESLFEYKPMNQFTLDIIANQRIFYPKPKSFNDPFDTQCSFRNRSVIIQSTDSEKISNAFPSQNPSNMSVHTRTDMSKAIASFKGQIEKMGVLSLSESCKDILMWSHYADDHRGICIELIREPINELGDKNVTRKVTYTKSYPSLNSKALLSEVGSSSSVKRVLYTKSEQWEYENEWRTFKSVGGEVYPLPGSIRSIIFGVRASMMDIEIVTKLVGEGSIDLYKAQLKESAFGIKLERIL